MNQFLMKGKSFSKMKAFSFLLLLNIILLTNKATAQFDGGIADNYNGVKISGTALVNNATGIVSCANGTSAEIVASRKITNIIRFGLDEESTKYLSGEFSVSIPVKIEYGPDASTLYEKIQTFTITYTKGEGAKYNAKNYLSFEGAKYVKITVTGNLSSTTIGSVNIADVVYLENEMRVTRYYNLQPGITPTSFTGASSVSNPVDKLPVSWVWPANSGHNATQLEWTWLETEMAPAYYFPNTTIVDPEKLFKDNATRIDLAYGKDNFNIPLFYDGQGQLYYRIRPVNILASGSRMDGQWTTPVVGSGICSYEGHNNDLNWQVRTSFAEEGKMKSVMEYYDGSLRSRQTVTKENVNNTTVTAETMYDYEGRPVIQILPVPGINSIIKYQANLNLFNTQTPNQNPAEFFDLSLKTATGADLYKTNALATTTGTSKYYSPQNDEINNGANKNIPDAEGFPYAVTRYMPDGTGRIQAQSGVGASHAMGSGKETKYYYGTPAQEELDGLFGTEVGNQKHYFKNMVKDANGQMSVSYTDMHGRTIATALAGDAPANLLPLDIDNTANYINQAGSTLTRNLLDKTTNIEKGNAIESINTLLVPVQNSYTFKYKLNPESLSLESCSNIPICYDCLYDLEISITDESGDQEPVVYKYKNLNVAGTVDDNCSTHNPFVEACPTCPAPVNNEITIVKSLEAGSYAIRKTLTLSESSLQKYKDLFFQPGKGICKTEQEIIDSVYAVLLSTSDCNAPVTPACEQCMTDLGNNTDFRIAYLTSLGYDMNANPLPGIPATVETTIQAAYNNALENCKRICNTSSFIISSKRQQMLGDMMPYGGQYATEAPVEPLVPGSGTSMFTKYNIFSTTNIGQPFYKKPKKADSGFDYYRTDLGDVDLQIHPDGTTTFLQTVSNDDFTNQFVNSWAEALLPYHPEYARLQYAESTLAPAYNWINTFNGTESYSAASANGYIMTDNSTLIDPLYTIVPSLKGAMLTWVTSNYATSNLSLWQIARGDLRCNNITDATLRQQCYNNGGTKVPPFADVTTTADKDQMWQAFRDLYVAARDNQLNDHIASHVPLTDETALIDQGYKLHFTTNKNTATQLGWTWYPPTVGAPAPGIPTTGVPVSTITATYEGRCSSYITQWRNTLLQCSALANMSNVTERDLILNEITTGMIAVCKKGSDASNPYGSSTVNPATPVDGSPRSFEEVITQVYAAHGISQRDNYYCNPYVIESPKPYGKNPKYTQEITIVIDSCACANFSMLSSQASAANYNPSSLSSMNSFLRLNFQDTLTADLHAALLNCSSYTAIVCETIQEAKTVSCYDPNPCFVGCADRPADSTGGVQTNLASGPTSQGSWTHLIGCFYDYPTGTSSLVNYLPDCQARFVSFFNGQYGFTGSNQWTWSQIQNSYASLFDGQTINVCTPCSTTVNCESTVNCHSVFTPHYLSSPQPLPEFLKCGFVPKKCLTCDNLVTYTAEFKAKFDAPINSGPIFTSNNLTAEQVKQNILFSKFLNFRTGYQYNWLEYAQAANAANCSVSGTGGGSEVVDLVVSSRTGNTPAQYIASRSITFLPGFESGTNDQFETLLQPNGGGGTVGGPQVVICFNTKALNDTTGLFVIDTLCDHTHVMAISLGQNIYQQQLLTLQANFEKQYREKCMAAKDIETFTVAYTNKEYHYTLYYYDMAGSLVKTVPPKGVYPKYDAAFLNSVKAARDACNADDASCNTAVLPPHSFETQYRYNSLGQVIAQHSPDANTSKFWYDRLGRLVVSQNAQQAIDNKYSYTLYDALGRITEVGQKPQVTAMTQTISQDDQQLYNWIVTNGSTREQITYTGYDVPFLATEDNPGGVLFGLGIDQVNMRNRVSYTGTKNLATDGPVPPFYAATFYTYDIHGNVNVLLQDYSGSGIPGMQNYKRIEYDYDLISGKVNRVSYQPDWYNAATESWVHNTDAFYHQYKYDAENRLTEAWTSRDKIEWERDAAYSYYKYGPLSRMVLGQQQVQGVDYAYTIQGCLKGVNGTNVGDGSADIGADGLAGNTHEKVARDIYGFGLHYFDDGNSNQAQSVMDYKPIGNTSLFARPNNNAFVSLYNGNIAAMSVNNAGLLKGNAATTNALPLFYNYRYDQLNRIRSMDAYKGLNVSNNTWSPVHIDDYKETVTYDPNGNITKYIRNGDAARQAMDDMKYTYKANTNQLDKVVDDAADELTNYARYNDVKQGQLNGNYQYDLIGNLINDNTEGVTTNIKWTVYGKIASITKANGTIISYTYDASGNRITKTVTSPTGAGGHTTIYVRDASGNVMGIYEKDGTGATELTENHLYGSSRIGIANKLTVPVSSTGLDGGYGNSFLSTFTRGEKNYELSNHLGNVLVTISDKKIAVDDNNNGTIDYYIADVVTATDYYPFGMDMPGRKFGGAGRYGFNGKERDKDMNSLTAYDYGFRIYNPAIGKFLSVDPLSDKYPWYTPYQFAGNIPIWAIDLDGAEPKGKSFNSTNSLWIKRSTDVSVNSSIPCVGFDRKTILYDITDEEGHAWTVLEQTSKVIGWGNRMHNESQFYYLSQLGDPNATAIYSVKKANSGKIDNIASLVPFETDEQTQKRVGNGVADILTATPFVAAGAILAAPSLIPMASVGVKVRIGSVLIDYTAQVTGNFISGKNGVDAFVDVNATSLVLSAVNPGNSWRQLIANNTVSSAFSISTTKGYNGVGGGKDLETTIIQAAVGTFTGRLSRGSDIGANKLMFRLRRINALMGENSNLSTFLQSEVRNYKINGLKISIGSGGVGNGINNAIENGKEEK